MHCSSSTHKTGGYTARHAACLPALASLVLRFYASLRASHALTADIEAVTMTAGRH